MSRITTPLCWPPPRPKRIKPAIVEQAEMRIKLSFLHWSNREARELARKLGVDLKREE